MDQFGLVLKMASLIIQSEYGKISDKLLEISIKKNYKHCRAQYWYI